MAPLTCDPTALDRTGATVVAAGVSLGSALSALTRTLTGSAGMAGDDPVGAALGHSYDHAAAKVIEAMADTRNGLCSIGDGVRVSAHNYALAEAMSDVSGRAAGLPTPQQTRPLTVDSPPPTAVGAGGGAPAGWGWVAPYIGMIWPSGDPAKLRAAAAAWTTAGADFRAAETTTGDGTVTALAAQQIPEGAAIAKALSEASDATINVARQCQTIAAQLTGYAAAIDQTHAAVLDLLSRICDPATGIKEIWELLTEDDEDQIKKIADDIRTVIDTFAREAATLAGQIEATVSATAAAAADMIHWAGKEWDHLLHATAVGRALDQGGQALKGVGEEGDEFAKGLSDLSPNRLQIDPVGYFTDVAALASGAAPLVGLGPDGGPGIVDSWKALGKEVTHWDEWSHNPAEALGKTIFDGATLALPGGPLSKAGKVGRDAAGALTDLRKPPLAKAPKQPSPKVPPEPPAGPKPPEAGHPASPAKPTPAHLDNPLPYGPTESKPPVVDKPAAGHPLTSATSPQHGNEPPTPTPTQHAPLPPHSGEPSVHPAPPRQSHDSHPPPPPAGHTPHQPGNNAPPHQPGEGGNQSEYSPDRTLPDEDIPPGDRHKISGHGAYHPQHGQFVVPRGSSITTYAKHGSTITDALGNLIETGGDTSGIYSQTFDAGDSIPNYTIYPPDGLDILGSPQTVEVPTPLSELIRENMGPVDLAACTYDPTCPTGMVYHVNGIFNKREGSFEAYER